MAYGSQSWQNKASDCCRDNYIPVRRCGENFSHLTSSADNYIENFDVIIFSGLIIGWGVSVAYRIVQKNIRICLVISAALMLLWMALRAIKYNSPADINTYGRYLWYSYYIAMVFLPLMMFLQCWISVSPKIQITENIFWLYLPPFLCCLLWRTIFISLLLYLNPIFTIGTNNTVTALFTM